MQLGVEPVFGPGFIQIFGKVELLPEVGPLRRALSSFFELLPFFGPPEVRVSGLLELLPKVGPLRWALSSFYQLWRTGRHEPIRQRYRHLIADRAMWSNHVVVYTPILAFSDGVVEA